ncbi:MAG: ATP-binding protein [Opitutales bacterium]
MFERLIKKQIQSRFFEGRIIVLYGARQVGKTTLVRQILDEFDGERTYLNCDEPDIRHDLTGASSTELKYLFGKSDLVVIDEAQRIKDIGLTLKLAVDAMPEKQIVATGSSSFELANQTAEPLTGRKFEFHLHPLSLGELRSHETERETKRMLDSRLIYGMYPAVVTAGQGRAGEILRELTGSYLYQDVLAWKDIRKPEVLDKLLRALALQLGGEVSLPELGQLLSVDKATVENYLIVLEQAFVVFRLPPFSRNLRNELKRMRKVYFWDVGLRNALINNLNPVDLRTDLGGLWENFVIVERLKALQNARRDVRAYFWRSHQRQEVDYVEESESGLLAAEIKRKPGKGRLPKSFTEAYPEAQTRRVHPESLLDFIQVEPGGSDS